MSTPAQITICGVVSDDTIAALVKVAMAAGAALLVQPRPIAALPAAVVEASPQLKALPPARSGCRVGAGRPVTRRWSRGEAAQGPLPDRAIQVLRRGPMPVAAFLKAAGMDRVTAREFVKSGAIVATGVTNGRRYALPGHPAKEAP